MGQAMNLFDHMYDDDGVPAPYSRADLEGIENLWDQRAALFLTPTSAIPEEFVASGPLHVRLAIVPPTYRECEEIPGYRNTRMWVDMLQRATRKIRWRPMDPVTIRVVRRDLTPPPQTVMTGAKALTDAYKASSAGRRDGHLVHYFGAIVDDAAENIRSYTFQCCLADTINEVGTEIEIREWSPEDGRESREILVNGSTTTVSHSWVE